MPVFNTWRLFLLVTIAGVYYFWNRPGTQFTTRSRRAGEIGVWNALPTKCGQNTEIALTFDDGPSGSTAQILDGLKAQNVPATFHAVDSFLNVATYANALKRAYDEGHLIGIRFNPQLDPSVMTAQALQDELLKEANGIQAVLGPNIFPKFVRMPWNQVTDQVNQVVASNGFVLSAWGTDSYDYTVTNTSDPQAIGRNILQGLAKVNNGSQIVLLRDVHTITAATIGPTLDAVLATKLQPVRLDKCLGVTVAYRTSNAPPPTPSSDKTPTDASVGGGTTGGTPSESKSTPSSSAGTPADTGPKSGAARQSAVNAVFFVALVASVFICLF